jgi:hypothetical protein
MLENRTMRVRLVQAGLEQAARFTWQRTAAQTLAVYRKVIA